MDTNNQSGHKRAPGEEKHEGEASRRIRTTSSSLIDMSRGQMQDAAFLRAHQIRDENQPQPPLDRTSTTAQQQLVLALARQQQREQEVYWRQQEFQHSANMMELAWRQQQQQQQQQQQHGVATNVGTLASDDGDTLSGSLGDRKYFIGATKLLDNGETHHYDICCNSLPR